MDIRVLQYVVAVAEARHFSRAAQRCHVSQPTLSMQIKKFEEYLGVQVFERGYHRVSVTREGAQVVAYARQTLDLVEAMRGLAPAQSAGSPRQTA